MMKNILLNTLFASPNAIKNVDCHNRAYLCVEEKCKNISAIYGFNCIKYNTLEEANNALCKKTTLNKNFKVNPNDKKIAIVTVCRFIPEIFDIYYLNYKLKGLFWLGKHTLINNAKQ